MVENVEAYFATQKQVQMKCAGQSPIITAEFPNPIMLPTTGDMIIPFPTKHDPDH